MPHTMVSTLRSSMRDVGTRILGLQTDDIGMHHNNARHAEGESLFRASAFLTQGQRSGKFKWRSSFKLEIDRRMQGVCFAAKHLDCNKDWRSQHALDTVKQSLQVLQRAALGPVRACQGHSASTASRSLNLAFALRHRASAQYQRWSHHPSSASCKTSPALCNACLHNAAKQVLQRACTYAFPTRMAFENWQTLNFPTLYASSMANAGRTEALHGNSILLEGSLITLDPAKFAWQNQDADAS